MKKLNLIKRLWTDSHEKQSPQRFARYAAMLIMLLTLGVGQMWADNTHVIAIAGENPNDYTVKVESNIGDNNTKWWYTFTRASSITFEGKKLYVGYFNDKYGGVNGLDIHYYDGDNWISKCTPYGSGWHTDVANHNDKVYNKDACSWYAKKTVSVGARVYFQPDANWTETTNKIWVGHANYQRYYSMSRVTNTQLYYGTIVTYGWDNAMGIGVVGNTSANDGVNYFTNAATSSSEYTGLKNWDINNTSANNAYLIVSNGDAGEEPTMSYHASHYANNALNYTLTMKYAVSTNGATPAELTSGYIPATITVSTYKFSNGKYNAVDESSLAAAMTKNGSTYTSTATAARTAATTFAVSSIDGDYAFLGWYTAVSGGDLLSSDQTYTTYLPTASATIYARFSHENNHAVAVTYVCTETSANVKSAENPKVGEITPTTFTAGTPNGYSFTSWTVGNGLTITSGSESTNSISVKTKSSGTYTLQANYSEVLTTSWRLIGDNATNSPFGDNYSYASGKAMSKKSGASATDKAYKTLDITHTGTFGFKVSKAAGGDSYNYAWGTGDNKVTYNRSYSGTRHDVYTGSQNPLQFVPDALGEYEFEVDYTSTPCYVKVTFPATTYTVSYAKGTVVGSDGAISATYSSVSFVSGTKVQSGKSVTLTAPAAKTGYTWKGWYTNAAGTTGKIDDVSRAITITVNADKSLYACYTINNHAVTYTAPSHGSYTITVGTADAVSANTTSDYGKQITLAANPATGYHFVSWSVYKTGEPATIVTVTNNKFTMPDYPVTVGATFTANTYSIHFNGNGNTSGTMSNQTGIAYDSETTITTNAFVKTGYTFAGWATSAGGEVVRADGAAHGNLSSTQGATVELYAKWTAKQSALSFDYQSTAEGHGTDGTISAVSATYDAAMPSLTGTLPTAAEGYAFMGFYDAIGGTGTQYYTETGASARAWDKVDATATLYAYFKKAEITTLALSAGTVLPEGSVIATPTVEPTPTGTHKICWKLLYNNGTEYSPQPTFTPGSGNVVSFKAPEASGTYKVRAQLRTGSECGAGTLLSEQVASFVVAGTHTVTIQYKCGDVTVKSSTVVEGVKPLEWSEEITPDEIFGYSFEKWVAGDGVTMTINGGVTTIETGGETTGKATTHAVQIKAIYDGKLIAKYTKKNIIYFKNTLGWTNVYYHDSYWDNSEGGAGNKGQSHINQAMSLVPGTTNIYYWEGTPTSANVAFTNATYDNYQAFWSKTFDAKVVYPSNPTCASSGDNNYGYNAGTPMFVPVEQDGQDFNAKDGGKAIYFNKGYWRAYDPTTGESGSTGYTLKIYNQTEGNSSRELLQSIPFTNADASGQIFKATINLEAAKGYGIKVERDNSLMYTNTTGHLHQTGNVVALSVNPDNYAAIWIKSTAAGDYDFIITCNGSGQLCLQATFPAAANDYRVLYTDNATWSNSAHTAHTWVHPSRVISAKAGATDTISFFVSKDNSPKYKIQKVNSINEGTGAITWTDVTPSWTSISVGKTGVYNFIFNQPSAGSISLSKTEAYTGNFYIRTDNAGSTKWENYRAEDHKMTYSEYAAKITHTGEEWKDFTHYFMKYVDKDIESGKYKNVKFTVANDYSPCISDTLVRQDGDVTPNNVDAYGNLQASANIRFMWNSKNNKLQRAYLAAAQTDGSKFLVLQGVSGKLLAPDGTPLSDANGNNHNGGTDAIQFTDKEHWMYEAEVKAVPGGRVKLYATYNSSTFYYYGDNTASFTGTSAIDLVTGNGGEAQTIRVVYDFKTDRLMAAWVPSDETINDTKTVNADIMLIREHQGQGHQINLGNTGSIKTNKTVYGVLRFNRWTLNNKSTETGHAVLPVGEQKSQYERFNYMISFPFDVKVGEIFGFGTIGRHYRIYYYDGLGRAKEGFFAERGDDNWRMIDDTDSILHANQGYLLQLNYIRMADNNTETWPQANMNEVELYFPAMNTINTISLADVTIPALGDAYNCKINLQPIYEAQGNPNAAEADRRVKDSYWRCIGVPGFTSYEATAGTWDNFNWKAETDNLPYLYEWQMDDNKLSVVSSATFTFKPMHAYLIQNGKSFKWESVAHPTIVAAPRRSAAEEGFYEFYLEMSKDEEPQDHTYVRLTDNENVTADFDFGQDLSKELNSGANIFTKVGYERLAANNLPLSEQTTIVPVGVKIAAEGNYTFAMPEGTHGIGVTLVDNETGDRTNLSLFDYSVNLTKGDYANRFILEISPVKQMPTDIENVQGDNVQGAKARKVMVDGILYIVKDGKVFDARGAKVK